MFRQIAASIGENGPAILIREPAGLLAARLEAIWATRGRSGGARSYPAVLFPGPLLPDGESLVWDHLIYAYLVENSRVAEIVRRLIFETSHGERLAVPRNPQTFEWLRSTEELFFSYGPPLVAMSTVSQLRPDPRATRRNAYWRMFGMDLNHGTDDGGPFPYEKTQVANRDFVAVFESFLRETWRAIENARNEIGPNPTNPAAIADLALRLQIMLNERRGGSATAPNLAREEFAAVAAMSWLHLLVDFDNEVLVDFRAVGTSPEERLTRLGERVGVPAHAHSHSYFILAPIVSNLLIEIEAGLYSDAARALALYLPAPPAENRIRDDISTIVDHWSRATGRNLKAAPVAPTPPSITVTPQLARAGALPNGGAAAVRVGAGG